MQTMKATRMYVDYCQKEIIYVAPVKTSKQAAPFFFTQQECHEKVIYINFYDRSILFLIEE